MMRIEANVVRSSRSDRPGRSEYEVVLSENLHFTGMDSRSANVHRTPTPHYYIPIPRVVMVLSPIVPSRFMRFSSYTLRSFYSEPC